MSLTLKIRARRLLTSHNLKIELEKYTNLIIDLVNAMFRITDLTSDLEDTGSRTTDLIADLEDARPRSFDLQPEEVFVADAPPQLPLHALLNLFDFMTVDPHVAVKVRAVAARSLQHDSYYPECAEQPYRRQSASQCPIYSRSKSRIAARTHTSLACIRFCM